MFLPLVGDGTATQCNFTWRIGRHFCTLFLQHFFTACDIASHACGTKACCGFVCVECMRQAMCACLWLSDFVAAALTGSVCSPLLDLLLSIIVTPVSSCSMFECGVQCLGRQAGRSPTCMIMQVGDGCMIIQKVVTISHRGIASQDLENCSCRVCSVADQGHQHIAQRARL